MSLEPHEIAIARQSAKGPSGSRLQTRPILTGLFALGLGIGVAIVGAHSAVDWYSHRSVPAKTWPPMKLSVGITAKLKTDWREGARYQFAVSPSSSELAKSFEAEVHSGDFSRRQFTLHFYDKSGFEVCKTEVLTTPTHDAENQLIALSGSGDFYCSRPNYLQLDRWNIAYRFLKLAADLPHIAADEAKYEPTPKSPMTKLFSTPAPAPTPDSVPISGADTLTGFDLSTGHLEVRSGKTFLVYREGERDTALGWSTWANMTHRQPGLHFDCDAHNECLIENSENKQALHGRMLH